MFYIRGSIYNSYIFLLDNFLNIIKKYVYLCKNNFYECRLDNIDWKKWR